MKNFRIIILSFFYLAISIFAKDYACKQRLPESINNYSPIIVPVISLDNKFLYFDRKGYPLNTGGCQDDDDIWFSENLKNGLWTTPQKLSKPINSSLSNVLFSLSPDGKKALLYTDYYIESFRLSGFVIADRLQNNFINIKPLKIKNYYNESKNFYGFLSVNNNILLLSIKSSNCHGNQDLYVSFLDESLQVWTEPINLGKTINSEFDEISPFLAYDSKTLYFASDRDDGLGNYDLYVSKRLDNTWQHWSKPQNLLSPINTRFKENGIYLTALSDSAYIISSETKIVHNDNINNPIDSITLRSGIYKVCLPKRFRPEPYIILKGIVENKKKQEIIKQKVNFTIKNNDNIFKYSTDDGNFLFVLNSDKIYNIKVTSENFKPTNFQINTNNYKKSKFLTKNIDVEPLRKVALKFPSIYFDFNESNLSEFAKQKISEKLKAINKIKSIKFKIIGYSDTTGSEKYNYILSLKRAKKTKEFLNKLGIDSKQITIEGKGENHKINKIDKENRRVEIIINY